jgi:hypothetical protein
VPFVVTEVTFDHQGQKLSASSANQAVFIIHWLIVNGVVSLPSQTTPVSAAERDAGMTALGASVF